MKARFEKYSKGGAAVFCAALILALDACASPRAVNVDCDKDLRPINVPLNAPPADTNASREGKSS